MKGFIHFVRTFPGRAFRKIYYTIVKDKPTWDRFFRYQAPRQYWLKRGGETYFQEQEAVKERTLRSEFIAAEVKALSFTCLLEIGCGYGKQLRNLASPEIILTGCDFSHSQLVRSKTYFPEMKSRIVEADAESIPFQSKTFDAVLSSAVILHNEYEKARRILAEIIRVSRKYLIHNEDIDISFSRYGYDLKATYERMNFKVVTAKQFTFEVEPEKTQFIIVELPHPDLIVKPESIPLQFSSFAPQMR